MVVICLSAVWSTYERYKGKHTWCQTYLGSATLYFGNIETFTFGVTLGIENCLYLGWACIGIDF